MLGTISLAMRRVLIVRKRANEVVTTQIDLFQQPEAGLSPAFQSILQKIINGVNKRKQDAIRRRNNKAVKRSMRGDNHVRKQQKAC